MNIILALAEAYIPKFIRRRKLLHLFAATADAFGTSVPSLSGLGIDECLTEFALFTKEKAEEAIKNGTETETRHRLYRNAHMLGMKLRGEFGVRSVKETMRLARIIYKIVGIDFRGGARGDVAISRCYFSRFYSPEVCSVISSLDAGLLSGLSGGGRLSFSERLTEGKDCCRATLSLGVKSP